MHHRLKLPVLTIAAFILSTGLVASAQQNPGNVRTAPGDNPNIQGYNGAGDNPQVMRDNGFLKRVTDAGVAEIALDKLATEKASSDSVKKLAQQLVDEHSAMNDKIAPMAASVDIKPPKKLPKADQQELTKLSGLSGPDFDKEYLSYEIKVHKKELQDFQTETAATANPQLKDVTAKGVTMIQQHIDMLTKLAGANGVS